MIVRLCYVACDGCGKPCGGYRDLATSGVEARRFARQQGWLRIPRRAAIAGGSPGRDYCPTCKNGPSDQEKT